MSFPNADPSKSLYPYAVIPDDLKIDSRAFIIAEKDKDCVEYIIIPGSMIKERAQCLAQQIVADYEAEGIEELVVLTVMNGALVFYKDLASFGLNDEECKFKVTPIFN